MMKKNIIMILCFVLVLGCASAAKKRAEDTAGMSQQTARGTVTGKSFTPGQSQVFTSYGPAGPISMPITIPPTYNVTFSFDGMTRTLDSQQWYNLFMQGQEVEIAYTKGRSGKVYINSVKAAGPPRVIPSFPHIIFDESFNDNENRWSIVGRQEAKSSIENGKYILEQKKDKGGWAFWSNKVNMDTEKDFIIEANIAKGNGVDNYGYGLLWGFKDIGNHSGFKISGDGHYKIYKRKDNEFIKVKGWTSSANINKGNVTNKLTIVKESDVTEFFINDQFVAEIPSPALFGNKLGFDVGGKMTTAVEYIKIFAKEPLKLKIEEVKSESVELDKSAELRELLNAGLITQEEYDEQIRKIKSSLLSPKDKLKQKISKLRELKEEGLITPEEFEKKRRALIDEHLNK
jgi:hypothetical protein